MQTLLFLSEGGLHLSSCTPIGKYRYLAPWKLPWISTTIAVGRPDNNQNHCRTGEECECEELLHLRRGTPLACRVMCFASSSFTHLKKFNFLFQHLHEMPYLQRKVLSKLQIYHHFGVSPCIHTFQCLPL